MVFNAGDLLVHSFDDIQYLSPFSNFYISALIWDKMYFFNYPSRSA